MARKARAGSYSFYQKEILQELGRLYSHMLEKDSVGDQHFTYKKFLDNLTLEKIQNQIPTTSFNDCLKILKSEQLVTEVRPTIQQFIDEFGFSSGLSKNIKTVFDFFNEEELSRKFYFLTPKGYRFSQYLRQKNLH